MNAQKSRDFSLLFCILAEKKRQQPFHIRICCVLCRLPLSLLQQLITGQENGRHTFRKRQEIGKMIPIAVWQIYYYLLLQRP